MKILTNQAFLKHDTGDHPENYRRLQVFDAASTPLTVNGEEYLHLVHSQDHIEQISMMSGMGGGSPDGDTRVSPHSYAAGVAAVGMTIMASQSQDFALVRPPGHHAYPDHASGFCLFNNIAVAAKLLKTQGKRVLIVDFDGHLGDGTSHIFYEDDEVLYWSLHQYPAFPGQGRSREIGFGKGAGYTVNVPLPPGSGDDIFIHAFKNFLPVLSQFEPHVIAISAGFDAHRFDPLLQLNVTNSTFYQLGRLLSMEEVPCFAVLEGGYNTDVLPLTVHNFIAGINKLDMPYDEELTSSGRKQWEAYDLNLHMGIGALTPYWKF